MFLASLGPLGVTILSSWAALGALTFALRRRRGASTTKVADPPWDTQRFRVERTHLFGPFYSVRVHDGARGCDVPLADGGNMLCGKAAARRAARFGIERYLRKHDDRSQQSP